MRNAEKSLLNSIKNNQNISSSEILSLVEKKGDDFVKALLEFVSETLDNYYGTEDISYLNKVFEFLNVAIRNNQDINRKIVARRVVKLEEKVDRIRIEKRKNFVDKEAVDKELEGIRSKLEEFELANENKDTKQYDFMWSLATNEKDYTFIESTLKKVPSMINVRDKNDISLYENLLDKYIESATVEDEEELIFLKSIILFISQQRNFQLTQSEKKKCLEKINKNVDWLTCKKKDAKKNHEQIKQLNDLREIVHAENTQKNDLYSIAEKYKIPTEFSNEVIEAVKELPESTIENYPEREVVDEFIITIDGANAVEIDDALSCRKLDNGNYLLGVHIASVLAYFPYHSKVIDEAMERVHSIYLPKKFQEKENEFNRTIPIFPYAFSAQKASLLADEPKLARSYFFEIDSTGEVIGERFPKTIITSNKRMTYDEVNKILKTGTPNEKLNETVKNLKEVTNILENKYNPSYLYLKIKESNEDAADLRVKNSGAEKIVYQSMLLTGNKVAEYFALRDQPFPCLYRVHEVKDATSKHIQSMINTNIETYGGEQFEKLANLVDGIYPKGWYDILGKHSGLGLEHYCHCTSALRRAPDIVVEHALETCYDKEPTQKELEELEKDIKKRVIDLKVQSKKIDWFVGECGRQLVKYHKR